MPSGQLFSVVDVPVIVNEVDVRVEAVLLNAAAADVADVVVEVIVVAVTVCPVSVVDMTEVVGGAVSPVEVIFAAMSIVLVRVAAVDLTVAVDVVEALVQLKRRA